MKSPLPKIIAVALACAASAAAGYWYGQDRSAGPGGASSAAIAGPKITSRDIAAAMPLRPGQPPTLENLLRASGKLDADLLARWAKNMGPDEVQSALKSLKDSPANSRRNDLMGALYNAWAERDPKSFLAASDTVTVPRLRETGVDAALKTWAAQDPQAALQWIKDNPGTASTAAYQKRYAAAIAGFAATDPQGALTAVTALAEDNPHDRRLKTAALVAMVDSLAEQNVPGQFIATLNMFNKMPNGASRDEALGQLAQRWAETDPREASLTVAGLTDSPQLRATLGAKVAEAWVANDPAAAAAWAAQMDQAANIDFTKPKANPADTANSPILVSAIRAWANYDLDAPGQFLNTLPASPAKDSSVAVFALRAGQEDPQSAMQWVGTISNEQMRAGVTMGVAMQWMQQDPAGFNQFLTTTTTSLSDQQKQMLSNVPPEVVQGMSQFDEALGGGDVLQRVMENAILSGRGLGGRGTTPPPLSGNFQRFNPADAAPPPNAAPAPAPDTATPGAN